MPARSSASQWGSLAKFFHWTTVIAILVQATIGLVMVELPKRPGTIPVYTFHKSLGLAIFAFALLRLLWRAFDPRPLYPATMPRWWCICRKAEAPASASGTCSTTNSQTARSAMTVAKRAELDSGPTVMPSTRFWTIA